MRILITMVTTAVSMFSLRALLLLFPLLCIHVHARACRVVREHPKRRQIWIWHDRGRDIDNSVIAVVEILGLCGKRRVLMQERFVELLTFELGPGLVRRRELKINSL